MGSEHLKLLVANEFPFTIAYAFRRSMDESDSRELACAVLQAVLELMGVVLAADYLSWEERTPALDLEVRRLFQSPPSCGVWRDWIYRVLEEHAQKGTKPFLPSLSGLLEREARKELTKLLEWRNRCMHGGAVFEVGDFRRLLTSLFGKVHSIHKASIFCPHSSRMSGPLHFIGSTLIKGESPVLPEVECRSEIPLATGLVHIHAADSGEVLELDPFLLYGRCDACAERHVFHFNRVSGKRVVYTSIPLGHEKSSAEAYATVEQMLLRRRAKKVRPRHFWIPGALGAMRTLREGDAIGPYVVNELIKLGGLSQIYKVTERATGSTYALKLLPIELSRDPLILTRFEEEVHNLRKLHHPNVVAIHAVGEDFGDRYMALDLALGGSINGDRCSDLSELKKPIPEKAVMEIGKQLCDGLQYIHEHGVLHRDLKPGNILVAGRRILIADFGISRARGDPKVTLTGMPVGTPEYMSPEQITEGEMDHRTDIYSLGCVLYELATGRPPFQAETPLTTAIQHLQGKPSTPSDLNDRISRGLSNIILKAIQKSPHLRQSSARELHEELSRASKDPAGPQVVEGDAIPQNVADEMRRRERRRYRRQLTGVVSVALLLLAVMGVWLAAVTVRKDRQLRSLVAVARTSWALGPDRWEEGLGPLEEARTRDPRHPAVLDLLGDLFTSGSLLVGSTSPAGLTIEVTPDPAAGREVGLSSLWSPRVLSPKTSFAAGERIPLAIGHYKLSFLRDGARLPAAGIIFIGHRHYLPLEEGWSWARVPHRATATLDPRTAGLEGIHVADSVEIPRLTVPTSPLEGYSWIHEGTAWISPDPSELSQRREEENISVPGLDRPLKISRYDGSAIVKPVEVARPYHIARDETTWAAFRAWFDRYGGAFCRSRQELDSNLWRVALDTRRVPIEVQRETWRPALDARVISADTLASTEEIIDQVFAEHLDFQRRVWEKFEGAMRKKLEGSEDGSLPMGGVFRDLAQAYARTHAPVDPRELRPWLESRITRSRGRIAAWTGLREAIAAIGDVEIDASRLPGDLLFRCFWVCPDGRVKENAARAYARWLQHGTYYAHQLPAAAIARWAGSAMPAERLRMAPGRLREILAEISRPSLWLWRIDRIDGELPVRIRLDGLDYHPVVAAYADDVAAGTAPVDKAHVLAWLDDQVREESDGLAFHEEVLARAAEDPNAWLHGILGSPPADRRAARFATRVFLFLMDYGEAMGWGLPTQLQWERSSRGADARAYPWGDAALGYACWTSRIEGAKPLTVTAARAYGRDISPFGVHALAANLSEWIVCSERTEGIEAFLKGGHLYSHVHYANAGYFISMEGGTSRPWTGFRVVRELRPLEEED